jgi:hypothetical protein
MTMAEFWIAVVYVLGWSVLIGLVVSWLSEN